MVNLLILFIILSLLIVIEASTSISRNTDYLHENGFFVGNSHIDLERELRFLKNIVF